MHVGTQGQKGSITVGNFNVSFEDDGPLGFTLKVNGCTARTQVTLVKVTGGEIDRKPFVDIPAFASDDKFVVTGVEKLRVEVPRPIME
jgi:hypothetical protein